MALTAQESAVVETYIITFLHTDFLETLSLYYAEGVAYSSKHPQNINNELRNALTHFARALNADTMVAAKIELDAAGRHIERFKRDCLKVAVVYSGRDVNKLITHAHRRFKDVDPNITLEASRIARLKVKATLNEAIGIDQSVPAWEAIARDIGKLREKIFDVYPSLDPQNRWFPLWAYEVWDWIKSIAGTLIVAVLAGLLLLAIAPDGQGTGNAIRKAIASFIAPSPAASIPSNSVKLDVSPPPKQ